MNPIAEGGVFSAHRASSPLHRVRKICLGSERPGTPLTLSPCMGPKRVSRRPPAHQARASGLNHPHVVRLADPDYPRCAVVVRPSAHKPRFPHLLNSRCEISSRRRYAAVTDRCALDGLRLRLIPPWHGSDTWLSRGVVAATKPPRRLALATSFPDLFCRKRWIRKRLRRYFKKSHRIARS